MNVTDNKTTSPYLGNDAITFERNGLNPGEWVEGVAPTNIVTTSNGTEIATESLGFKQADGTGKVSFTFNASPSEGIVERTALYGWLLPAGIYQVSTRIFSDNTGASIESADFEIVAPTLNSIVAASVARKGKKK